MGLVMFARYGENSPLDKGYVKTNDQVHSDVFMFEQYIGGCFLLMSPDAEFLHSDGIILCDGCVQGSAWPFGTVCGLSLQWSTQVKDRRP